MSLFEDIYNSYILEDMIPDETEADDVSLDDEGGGDDAAATDETQGEDAGEQPDQDAEEDTGDDQGTEDQGEEDKEGGDEAGDEMPDEEADDVSLDDDEEGRDETGEGDEQDTGDETGEEGSEEETDIGDNDPSNKLKDLEKSIFDQLSPEQQKSKVGELKNLFTDTYNKSQDILNIVSAAEKDPKHAKVYEYIMNSLVDLQKYIKDYLANIFDSKTYIENMTELQKYLNLLDTMNNVFIDIKNGMDDEGEES